MDHRVQKVITLIEDNNRQRLSPAAIAHTVNLSLPRLRTLFKTETGVPLARYQKSFRIREAQKLLRDTFLSVKEIMLKVGISDESHFVRDFKKMYGLTPTQYRRVSRAERPAEEASPGDD